MPVLSSAASAAGYGRVDNAGIVTSGLYVNLDAGNSKSYSGSGSTWSNLTGNSNHATLFNSPSYSTNNAGYMTFNDTSLQYGTIPNLGSLSRWTVEAWSRPTGAIDSKITAIVTNEWNMGSSLNFNIGQGRATLNYNMCAGFYDGIWHNANGFMPTLNTWYQFLGTYDGTTIKQYSNGALLNSTAYTGNPTSGGVVRIARRWDSDLTAGNFYKGDIACVRIYNHALTDAEISQNYNAMKSRFALT
jgi:hypothetical protein